MTERVKYIFVILSFLAVSTIFAEEHALFTVYAPKYEGRVTANGEIFSHTKTTAATNKQEYLRKTITLCYLACVSVWVNDVFGPTIRREKRTRFDLTKAAAESIGMKGKNWGTVRDGEPLVGNVPVSMRARENLVFWIPVAKSSLRHLKNEVIGKPIVLISPEQFCEARRRSVRQPLARMETTGFRNFFDSIRARKDVPELSMECLPIENDRKQ